MAYSSNGLTGLIPVIYQGLDKVSREMVGFIPAVNRNATAESAALGQTITVPISQVGAASDISPAATPPETGTGNTGNIQMQITKSRMVPIAFSGEEQRSLGALYNTVLADRFSQGFRTLANEVETDIAGTSIYASRAYGTAGTTPFASGIGETASVRKILADNGAPMSNLKLVIDTSAGANLRSNTQLTKANESGTTDTLRMGTLLDLNGFQVRESAGITTHTKGAYTTGDTVSADAAVGDTAISVTFTAGDYLPGDVIYFGTDTSNKYVITSVGTNTLTIAEPGLRVAVASTTEITITADYTPNMAFDGNAIQLIARQPLMPQEGDMAADVTSVTDPISGITFQVAMYRGYHAIHFEVGLAWGVKLIKPEHTALLLG